MIKRTTSGYIPIFIVVLILFFSAGCKKKERVHYTIADDVKQYGLFQKDSYWIYLNETTQTYDCTFVNQTPVFYTENLKGPEDEPLIDNIRIYLSGKHIEQISLAGNYLMEDFSPFSLNPMFISGVNLHKSRLFGSSIYTFVSEFDSLQIEGRTYYQVIQTREDMPDGNTISDSINQNFFLAKNIGLIQIKREYPHTDTTWSLLRYHVVQ